MIIDVSYFRNKLVLPQANNQDGQIYLNAMIDQYEQEFLFCALGFNLQQAFMDGIEGSGEPSDDRWNWLLNGQNYTINGKNGTWFGFKNHSKLSPIANYVYYQVLDGKTTNYTLNGNVVPVVENNTVVNPMDKMVDAWNRMVDLDMQLLNYLRANKHLYPEWSECHSLLVYSNNTCSNPTCHYLSCPNNVFKKKTSFDV